MNASKDYYRILEVHHEASREMIDRAKRVLLQRYHPDHNIARTDWAAAQTREVLEAYDVISDDAARKQYDAARQGGDSQRRQSTGQRQASSPSGGRARAGSASRTAASSTKGKAGASRGQAQRRTARPKPPPRATVHPSSTPGIRIATCFHCGRPSRIPSKVPLHAVQCGACGEPMALRFGERVKTRLRGIDDRLEDLRAALLRPFSKGDRSDD